MQKITTDKHNRESINIKRKIQAKLPYIIPWIDFGRLLGPDELRYGFLNLKNDDSWFLQHEKYY